LEIILKVFIVLLAEYNILGEVSCWLGYINLAVIIAQINILGKDYYDELIKQGLHSLKR
jgi:hypothetical protein